MRINKIEVQKNRSNYFNLYTDEDTFLFSVTEETLLHFGLKKDQDLSNSELEEIRNHDTCMRCVYQAFRYLSRRPHLENELKRKLRQKQFSAEVVDQTIEYLQNKNHLDDPSFITAFIDEQIHLRRSGPQLIRKKLFEKGAIPQVVDPMLEEIYSENQQFNNALILFDKKSKHLTELDRGKYKEKMFRFLQQRGYSWPVIERVFNNRLTGE
jgi:regulatory protein